MKNFMLIIILTVMVSIIVNCQTSKEQKNESVEKTDYEKTDSNFIPRESQNFEEFIKDFLSTCFFGKNTDSMIYKASPTIKKFIHSDMGFGRYWNPGAFKCLFMDDGYGYSFVENIYGKINPEMKNAKYFKGEAPINGFCEESTSAAGIYYKTVSKFPDCWDMIKDKSVTIELPKKYTCISKMRVDILHKKYIIKTIYFGKVDGIWWLLFFDDADCSA